MVHALILLCSNHKQCSHLVLGNWMQIFGEQLTGKILDPIMLLSHTCRGSACESGLVLADKGISSITCKQVCRGLVEPRLHSINCRQQKRSTRSLGNHLLCLVFDESDSVTQHSEISSHNKTDSYLQSLLTQSWGQLKLTNYI